MNKGKNALSESHKDSLFESHKNSLFESDRDSLFVSDKDDSRKQFVRRVKKGVSRKLREENGNVESALVLIPMLILFLIGIQLIVATNIRNIEMALAQGDASARAISHQYQPADEVIEVGGQFEKIQILITHRLTSLPHLVPGLAALMGGNLFSDVVGIAVIEPTNP
jgi:hypothetical protein